MPAPPPAPPPAAAGRAVRDCHRCLEGIGCHLGRQRRCGRPSRVAQPPIARRHRQAPSRRTDPPGASSRRLPAPPPGAHLCNGTACSATACRRARLPSRGQQIAGLREAQPAQTGGGGARQLRETAAWYRKVVATVASVAVLLARSSCVSSKTGSVERTPAPRLAWLAAEDPAETAEAGMPEQA